MIETCCFPPARDVLSQATAAGSTTTLVDTNRSEPSGYFIGYAIAITAGTDAGQASTVTGYNASTGTLTFSPALSAATTSTSAYTLTSNVLSGTSTSSGSTTTLVDSSLAQPTGEFVGWTLTLTSGTYSGKSLVVTGYSSSTHTLTFAPALAGSVASSTTFTLAQPALLTHTDYDPAGGHHRPARHRGPRLVRPARRADQHDRRLYQRHADGQHQPDHRFYF